MSSDDAVYLHHIYDAIEQIERYTRGMSESEFFSRAMVQDAVIRQIQLIEAAAACISVEFQGMHPKFPWPKMMGLSKKIIPEDFTVNLSSVWNAVQDELPLHKQAIKKLF